MNILILIILLAMVAIALFETYFTNVFVTSLAQEQQDQPADSELPLAAIVLCLRGADPFLPNCLQALLTQNYPNYQLRIVVDSPEDPAWAIATNWQDQTAIPVQVSALQIRRDTCSLKCSALVQAISNLEPECEVVALVDADTIPHPDWLRELVTPLTQPQIGVTTGNRWYIRGHQWGSLCRYLWNVAAVGQMYLYQIPWGGSLAIKTELVRQAKLLEKWEQAFCEDTMLRRVLQEQGLQIQSVASLMMVNREECTLSGFRRWVSRQLLNSKLYHPGWLAILIYGSLTTLVPAAAFMLSLAALLTKQWTAAIGLGGFLAVYIMVLGLLIAIWETAVRRKLMRRDELLPRYPAITNLKLLLAIPLTQLVCAIALWQTVLTKQVEWRGITYQIKGPWNVQLLEYFPYQYLNRNNPKTSL